MVQLLELQQLVKRTVAAKSTDVEKRTNAEYRQMQERLDQLLVEHLMGVRG